MTEPTYSVVIPTYNRCQYLREAVASVIEQGQQVELIVVDDGSSDETADYLAELRQSGVTVITHAVSRERSAARNSGLYASSSDWILFLDDDDKLAPGALRAWSDAGRHAARDVVALLGAVRFFDEEGECSEESWPRIAWTGDVLADCVLDPFIGPNRAMLRRTTVLAVGGWSEHLPPFEDRLLSLQLAALGPAMLIPQTVTHRRRHANQSDLSRESQLLPRIREIALSGRDSRSVHRVAARAEALELIFREHRQGRTSRRRRVGVALRVALLDWTQFGNPLARRTTGAMTIRLLVSAFKP